MFPIKKMNKYDVIFFFINFLIGFLVIKNSNFEDLSPFTVLLAYFVLLSPSFIIISLIGKEQDEHSVQFEEALVRYGT